MAEAQTKILCFLFTDIVGSSRQWERHPAEMGQAIRLHDERLGTCIEGCGGVVFKTVGDAFCASFENAADALRAAIEIQLAIQSESWPSHIEIAVRTAIHAGSVEVRGGDYFGPPVNRVARLMAIAHANQILVSGVIAELGIDALPEKTQLEDLGEHRLRDLGRSERVFQLCHEQLPRDFPPLLSLESPDLPNNLPKQLTSFVGRSKELAEIRSGIEESRLLTLTGSGGSGKTRLALQAAAESVDDYADGVWFVDFSDIVDPGAVPLQVGTVFKVTANRPEDCVSVLIEELRNKELLLILDNCEHLLPGIASLVKTIMQGCQRVRLLLTSRERLRITGEKSYRVPSLDAPTSGSLQTVESLCQFEAVRLFIERAKLHEQSFEVTSANAPAVASICARLDGIPLAIELAASRIRSLSAEEIESRLHSRFRLLTGSSRDAMPRQQTLRALIDWSFDLLDECERLLFERLSVFSGGWTLEAAEYVCSSPELEDFEVLDVMTSLIDKSLVTVQDIDEQRRYLYLESVREYALERLTGSEGELYVRRRHCEYYAKISFDPSLAGSLATPIPISELKQDLPNLRAAFEFDADSAAPLHAMQVFVGNCRWMIDDGRLAEANDWADRLYDKRKAPELKGIRRHFLALAGWTTHVEFRTDVARSYFLELFEFADEGSLDRVRALNGLGLIAQYHDHDFLAAVKCFARTRDLCTEDSMLRDHAVAELNFGSASRHLGRYDDAVASCKSAFRGFEALNDSSGQCKSAIAMGRTYLAQCKFDEAEVQIDLSAKISREAEHWHSLASVLIVKGTLFVELEKWDDAIAVYNDAIALLNGHGIRVARSIALSGMAWSFAARGEIDRALDYAFDAIRLIRLPGEWPDPQFTYESAAVAAGLMGDKLGSQELLGVAKGIFLADTEFDHENLKRRQRMAASLVGLEFDDIEALESGPQCDERALAIVSRHADSRASGQAGVRVV